MNVPTAVPIQEGTVAKAHILKNHALPPLTLCPGDLPAAQRSGPQHDIHHQDHRAGGRREEASGLGV